MKIRTYGNSFDVDIDITNVTKMGNQEFVMALFEYTPCDNWSAFLKQDIF